MTSVLTYLEPYLCVFVFGLRDSRLKTQDIHLLTDLG